MIKLMQGDCLELMESIPTGSVDMVLTDPPYGTTACKWDTSIDLDLMWYYLRMVIKPNAAIVLMAAQPFTSKLVMSNVKEFKYCWVWVKNLGSGHLNSRFMPMRHHEDIAVFVSSGRPTFTKEPTPRHYGGYERAKYKRSGKHFGGDVYGKQREIKRGVENDDSVNPRSVLYVDALRKDHAIRIHPTQKPVALMEYLIKTYTNPGETVLDFTMGSGTTGVACKNLGRSFIGIELDKEYFRIASERITGTKNPQPKRRVK